MNTDHEYREMSEAARAADRLVRELCDAALEGTAPAPQSNVEQKKSPPNGRAGGENLQENNVEQKWQDLVSAAPAPKPIELPADIIESLLAVGPVEWGVSLTQADEKHASDLLDTLHITREHFGVTEEETGIHGVYPKGTGTVLATPA